MWFPGITSHNLAHNPCLMLVARTVGNQIPPHRCLFFHADSMLKGFGILFHVDCMFVTVHDAFDQAPNTLVLQTTKAKEESLGTGLTSSYNLSNLQTHVFSF